MISRSGMYLGFFAAVVLTVFGMMAQGFVPGAGLVALAGLLTLPGALLIHTLGLGRLSRLEQTLYIPGLSILVLILSGLVSNELFKALGNMHPLASSVQIPWTTGLLLVLFAAAWLCGRKRRFEPAMISWPSRRTVGLVASLAVLPALAAIGATSLNNGGTSLFTMAAYGLAAALAVALVAWRRHVPAWLWAWAVFAVSLMLLWSTSLRGLYITGHDIQLEYYVFQLTDTPKLWSMSHFHDAYNACLSITILPVVLKTLTGIGAMTLYKVVYQAIFALCAVGIFTLARRYTTPALAFLSSFIFMTFPTFVIDMPMLTRQEIAFVFFTLLVLAVFNRRLVSWRKWILILMLVAGVVLSHYSTSFVMIMLLGGTWVITTISRLFMRFRRHKIEATRRYIPLGLVVAAFMAVFLWTGLYTKTGGNITAQLAAAARALPNALKPQASNDNSAYTLVKSKHISPQESVDAYAARRHDEASATAGKESGLYPDGIGVALIAEPAPLLPITAVGQILKSHGIDPGLVTLLGKGGYAMGVQAGILLAVIFSIIYRRRFHLKPEYVAMAPVAVGLLVIQVVLPVIDYGLFRMIQQELVFLALPLVLAVMELLQWLKLRSENIRLTLVTGLFAAAFLVTSGFAGQVLGATGAQLPLSNSGFYYDAYYTHSQDVALAKWLKNHYPAGYPIHSDTFARMKIMANAGITTVDGLTPGELPKESYVVLAGANVTHQRVALYEHGQLLFYDYDDPAAFLDTHKNLIYSTNRTRVYH